MDVKLISKCKISKEAQAYLDASQKVVAHAMEHISPEETMRRLAIYGFAATCIDENGQFQYIEADDIMINIPVIQEK